MSHPAYEVQVAGEVPPQLTRALCAATASTTPAETALLTNCIDDRGLDELIDRLSDLNVDLLELKGNGLSTLRSYEIHVGGRLGPIMLASLPHRAAASFTRQSVLTLDAADAPELLEILRALDGLGLQIMSVRLVGHHPPV